MNVFQAILMGIVQGIAEFLPVSSSGHLAIFQTRIRLYVQQVLKYRQMSRRRHGKKLRDALHYSH